jgi:hypothetical protein
MVVLNNNDKEQTLDVNRFKESLGASTNGYEVLSGKDISLQSGLVVPAKSSMIIELK